MEGPPSRLQIVLGGLGIFDGAAQGWILLERLLQSRLRRHGKSAGHPAGSEHDWCGHFVDDTHVARRHIVQVGLLRRQVDLGQGQTALGVLDIHPTAGPRLGATQELLVDSPMFDIVLLHQLVHVAETHHVEVGAACLLRHGLSRLEQFEIAGEFGLAKPLDIADGCEAVINHLVQGDGLTVAPVVQDSSTGLFQGLAANAGGDVQLGQQGAAGHVGLAIGGLESMPLREHFRAAQYGLLHYILQGLVCIGRLRVVAQQGKANQL